MTFALGAQIANLRIELKPIDDLMPYAMNARTHSDFQVKQIADSIREFGFTNPVLTDGNDGIIAGHGRVLAALSVGLREVPTINLAHLTDTQKRAYIIADNKLALNAGWDVEMLKIETDKLLAEDFDLTLTGFSTDELTELFAGMDVAKSEADPDDVPDPEADAVSQIGDVWVMGRHRIICGDSTQADVVAKVLNGVKPHLMVTDPPYGVEYDANWRNEALRADGTPIAGRAIGKVKNDGRADWRETWAFFPGDVAYVWCASLHNHEVADSLLASGFALRSQIIWAKSNFAISRADYHWQHEPCWYVVRTAAKGHWNGDRKQTTLWQIPKPAKSETGHSTQKPVECMKRPIENNSSPGQAVYEPFSGSGTTIIAGEMTGRSVHAIELNPLYVDVAVRRWQTYAGGVATLDGDGRSFAEVETERLPPRS